MTKDWTSFTFFSQYYGSHEERGEGDTQITYLFRPGIDVEQWKEKRFSHGGFSQAPENDKFEKWVEGMQEGRDYVVGETEE